MTIKEAENFYKQDTHMYEINKNKELLNWLKEQIKSGYRSYMDINDLQEMLNFIANWYEIKYPEKEFELSDGARYYDFPNIKSLSKEMNMEQLLFRLPSKALDLINCYYRSSGGYVTDIYDDKENVIGYKYCLGMCIPKKNANELVDTPFIYLCANVTNGEVANSDLKKYTGKDAINLEELLTIFKAKYSSEFDFKELEKCIYYHEMDKELRKRILELVALKLLYSPNTLPKYGYKRAKRFINEFNQKLNLNLSSEKIDEIMPKNTTEENLPYTPALIKPL